MDLTSPWIRQRMESDVVWMKILYVSLMSYSGLSMQGPGSGCQTPFFGGTFCKFREKKMAKKEQILWFRP